MEVVEMLKRMPIIRSGNILLRPLQKCDIIDMQAWEEDEAILKYSCTKERRSIEPRDIQFEREVGLFWRFHWGIQFDNKVVGDLWLHIDESNSSAKLAYRVAPSFQGRGIATESIKAVVSTIFKVAGIDKIWADVFTQNVSSIRVLEKSGFQREMSISQKKGVGDNLDYYIYAYRRMCV